MERFDEGMDGDVSSSFDFRGNASSEILVGNIIYFFMRILNLIRF